MTYFNLALAFIQKYYKIGLYSLAVLLILDLIGSRIAINNLKKDNSRLSKNMISVTDDTNRELTLKQTEYDKMNGKWKISLDSVLKANRIKKKAVSDATNINIRYDDTSKTNVVHKDPILVPSPTPLAPKYYKIPVQVDGVCWGMKGYILSADPQSKLEVSDRNSSNSIQLFIVRKQFLGFLWYTGESEHKAFSDCGQLEITQIHFVKK